ncbi:hypothetical protein GGR57DRAFT_497989 [Xylariaceae sp. FL1272]|nr:hypothetical protein GGR57DRAFT_497989 [Xylariaceae sp. FL1272]
MTTSSHQDEADKRLWKTGMVSDITMRCGTRTWKLHKAILVSRVPTLSMLARSQGPDGIRDIRYPDAEAVGCMLEWVYTKDVAATSLGPRHSWLDVYVRLFHLGEVLNLEQLCEFCVRNLKELLSSTITNQLPRPQGNGRLLGEQDLDGIFVAITSAYEHNNPRITSLFKQFIADCHLWRDTKFVARARTIVPFWRDISRDFFG